MPPPEITVSGTVAALSGACPTITFTLDTVAIVTNASTTYGGGSSCTSVKNGEKRSAVGIRQRDGRLLVSYISGPVVPPPTEITVNGTVGALGGACPAITFTLDTVAIVTNSSTTYGGGSSCTSVKNGERRYAVGTKQSDGRLLVRYVTGPATTLSN